MALSKPLPCSQPQFLYLYRRELVSLVPGVFFGGGFLAFEIRASEAQAREVLKNRLTAALDSISLVRVGSCPGHRWNLIIYPEQVLP